MSQDNIHLCPKCASPSIDVSELAGGTASCRICSWTGTRENVYTVPFSHGQGGSEGIALEFFNDMRRVLGDKVFMTNLTRFLSRWGFVDLGDPAGKQEVVRRVARYGAAAARAMVSAVINEREQLEKEAHNERIPR